MVLLEIKNSVIITLENTNHTTIDLKKKKKLLWLLDV